MRYLFFSAFLFLFIVAGAQVNNDIKLPTIIPPSPEVAQLGKVADPSVGLHTGSANVSIPIYSFSVNSAKVNIGLSYNSNGVKVDEIPSRVGMGWNLIAGGVVSREIHDDPDGDVPYKIPPSDLTAKNQTMLEYLHDVTSYDFDTEWDEYSYSFNGMSGKFFLDDSGNGYCIPHNNFKVKVLGHNTDSKSVEIITGDGIKYQFGLFTVEKTKSISISGGDAGFFNKQKFYETAWFLDKIITPEGRTVFFNYDSIAIYAATGRFETLIKPLTFAFYCETGDCLPSEQRGLNAIEYNTHYLTNIISDGISIDFRYESRQDGGGDNRLKQIDITAPGAQPVKRYRLDYIVPSDQSVANKRFFLTKLKQFEIGSYPEESLLLNPDMGNWLSHQFLYKEIDAMTERLSPDQDWFGYANGASNGIHYAPYIPSIDGAVVNGGPGYSANRNPGTLAMMQRGVLTKVVYPTGGSDELEYEPHTIVQNTSTGSSSHVSVNGGGIGVHEPRLFPPSDPIVPNANQQAILTLSSYKSPALPDEPGGEGDLLYELRLKKSSTGEVVLYRKYFYYTTQTINIELLKDVSYYLELTIWGERNAGTAEISFNPTIIYSTENKIVGGIRVKKISSFDPISNKYSKKFYTYSTHDDLTRSTGVGPLSTVNHAFYELARLCDAGDIESATRPCPGYMITSSSITPYYTFGGSNVAYATVLESDDPMFANGFTEHFFHTYYPGTSTYNILLGNSFLGTPSNISTDLNGIEYLTKYYRKKPAGGFAVIKQLENKFETTDEIVHQRRSLIVRKRYEDHHHTVPPAEAEFAGYDLAQYNYSSLWLRQFSKVTTDYDLEGQNPVVNTTNYIYSNTTHLQPNKTETTTSDASTIVLENKYPIDFANPLAANVYQKMVELNRIQDVIEVESLKGTTEVKKQSNEFEDWNSDGKIIYPKVLKTKLPVQTDWDNRMRFHSYDVKGNVLEVSKENDVKHTYIWDHYQKQPIAEVINGGQTQVAYSSFEADGKGNWTFAGTPTIPVSPNVALTGLKVYNTSSPVSKVISITGKYVLSYWSKTGTKTVTGGTVLSTITGRSANGWVYYEHLMNMAASSTLTIAGSGDIDELRLYPEKSQMTTLTYSPLVGISTQCDSNNRVTYYVYDGFGRISTIRDQDNNIIKKFDYNYQVTSNQ